MKQGTTADVVDFEMLFSATPDLYLILDPTLRIIAVNEAYLQATLTKREQLIGKPLFEIFPDNPGVPEATGVANLHDSLQAVLKQKTANTMAVQHYDIRKADGTFEQRFWSPKNTPVFDSDNHVRYIIHRVEDVTAFIQSKDPNLTYEKSITTDTMDLDIFQRAQEIQKAHKLLQEKDDHLRLALEASQTATWQWDLINDDIKIDDFMYPMFGLKHKDEFPKNLNAFMDLVHPDDRYIIQTSIKKTLEAHDRYDVVYRIILPDQSERTIAARGYVYMDDNNKPEKMAGVCIDITELSGLRKNLQLLTDEAKEQNRRLKMSNQLLEEFAYTVSHDLQEPLRMIGGFVDLLKRRYQDKLDEKADHYIYYIVDGVERMQNLIGDLLTYSRLSNAEKAFESVSMDKTLAWAISNLQSLIESTQTQIHYQKMPTIFGNNTQMGQLLQNLIANAIHYRRKDVAPIINIAVEERENNWLFKVEDNGIGIAEEHRERIFKLFQRLNAAEAEPYKGTGLGLSLCKRIMQNHNGDIWIESDGNHGSTFLFTLPKHEGVSS